MVLKNSKIETFDFTNSAHLSHPNGICYLSTRIKNACNSRRVVSEGTWVGVPGCVAYAGPSLPLAVMGACGIKTAAGPAHSLIAAFRSPALNVPVPSCPVGACRVGGGVVGKTEGVPNSGGAGGKRSGQELRCYHILTIL